jgi:hypothetical protein
MSLVNQVRMWTPEQWEQAVGQWKSMGADITWSYDSHENRFEVEVRKGDAVRVGFGHTKYDALVDITVKWLEADRWV